eukprot:382693-Prymnesium_polylepis.1
MDGMWRSISLVFSEQQLPNLTDLPADVIPAEEKQRLIRSSKVRDPGDGRGALRYAHRRGGLLGPGGRALEGDARPLRDQPPQAALGIGDALVG